VNSGLRKTWNADWAGFRGFFLSELGFVGFQELAGRKKILKYCKMKKNVCRTVLRAKPLFTVHCSLFIVH